MGNFRVVLGYASVSREIGLRVNGKRIELYLVVFFPLSLAISSDVDKPTDFCGSAYALGQFC